MLNSPRQELPKRKQVVTQERSKVIRETDNPFGDEEDEQPQPQPSQAQAQASSSRSPPPPTTTTPVTSQISSFSYVSSKTKKKDKDKKSGKKHRKFDLEAEKDQMKTTIAESSIAATNLSNALQSINRERERISENPLAAAHFETCKQLRRKVLRYVRPVSLLSSFGLRPLCGDVF